ncbi:MAG: type IV secretory system conjugative DNA transfer family protein [Chloroflexi bacterium]|nr:type IV secretory system conjugative DNA transfer family protein [Chloroflexota bacterium]
MLGQMGNFPFAPKYVLKEKHRPSHMYVIGLTGMGKSKFLEHCIYQDIVNGRGCGVIDPHSDLIDDLLSLLDQRGFLYKPEIREKIIYLDPSRTDRVTPFNVLRLGEGESSYDLASSILEAFRRAWPESLREAPHFSNLMMASLITLIENDLTLVDMPKLLADEEFRENCLERVRNQSVLEFFHDRYDRWGRETPTLIESSLNKVSAFTLNPRLNAMLGQQENHLDFREIMDEGKVLLVSLGKVDVETNRLLGNLITTGLEREMRSRKNRQLWNLTIDEFANYVANDGSAKTLATVFSEGRKFGLGLTVAHQDIGQLSQRMLGAISNVYTKVIFGIGRLDAEYFGKTIGFVDPEEVKRSARHANQYELFSSLSEQWEKWIQALRFQAPRQMSISLQNGTTLKLKTFRLPDTHSDDMEVYFY